MNTYLHKLPNSKVAVLLGLLLAVAFFIWGCLPTPGQVNVTLSEAIALSKSQNIQSVEINTSNGRMTMTAAVSDTPLTITDANGNQVQVNNGDQLFTNIDSLTLADLQQLGFVLPADYSTNASGGGIGSTLLVLLPLLIFIALIFFLLRAGRGVQNQAMGFIRSRVHLVSGDRPKVTFADVAGVEEAKEDLREVVEFLTNRWKFQSIGANIPKGVLLVGPPGTGKTLLARAVAGEANVPFFSVSGSEFVELYVGVGAARVRDLFQQAKRNAPSIIFIDELDAVGRLRAAGVTGSHEEREQTLNQILVEMDGFDPNIGVIVLSATNRIDVLDPALLRPGRFDRRAVLELPDTSGRAAILQIHARGKKLDSSVNLATVAKETHGFSGADLANLVNEAAILAVRRGKTAIGMAELEESIDRVIAGPERRSLRVNPRDKETTAYHESGHALVAHILPNVDPVHKISIVARGSMGGYTRLLTEDRYFLTASQFKDTLAVLLAGHAAEEIMLNEISTGPHSDIRQATALAWRMITQFGMSKNLGLRTYGDDTQAQSYFVQERKDYSEAVAKQIDEEIKNILDEANELAKKIIQENKDRLAHLAEKLLVEETLEGEKLEAAFTEPISGAAKKVADTIAQGGSR